MPNLASSGKGWNAPPAPVVENDGPDERMMNAGVGRRHKAEDGTALLAIHGDMPYTWAPVGTSSETRGTDTVYRQLSVIAMAPVWNEEQKIGEVVRRTPRDVVDEVLVIDDGSTDGS